MKVIKSTAITPAMVISSNAVEAYSAWSSTTTYSKDQIVDYGTNYWISLVNSNLNNLPDAAGSTYWELVGPDNTHAMFDNQVSTATTSTTPLIVTVAPGITNSVAFVGLVGTSITVEMTDGGASPTLYSETIELQDNTAIIDWYAYFFEPFNQKSEAIFTGLPPYFNAYITVTLESGGNVAIGEMICGNIYTLSDEAMEQGSSIGIIDYSRKDTDTETGKTTFVRRAFSKRMSGQFLLENSNLAAVQQILAEVRATPTIFIGSEDANYSPLVIYGFYRDFSIDIAYPTKSWCRLEVEGLT